MYSKKTDSPLFLQNSNIGRWDYLIPTIKPLLAEMTKKLGKLPKNNQNKTILCRTTFYK